MDKKILGARLKKLRLERHESQKITAELLGVTVTQISDLEQGKTGTNLDRLVLLCQYYHVSADYLLGLSDKS